MYYKYYELCYLGVHIYRQPFMDIYNRPFNLLVNYITSPYSFWKLKIGNGSWKETRLKCIFTKYFESNKVANQSAHPTYSFLDKHLDITESVLSLIGKILIEWTNCINKFV